MNISTQKLFAKNCLFIQDPIYSQTAIYLQNPPVKQEILIIIGQKGVEEFCNSKTAKEWVMTEDLKVAIKRMRSCCDSQKEDFSCQIDLFESRVIDAYLIFIDSNKPILESELIFTIVTNISELKNAK